MAIKIRCTDCQKKISIDEAFAGGMCRCPYCKALVFVEETAGAGDRSPRPAAPGARPSEPGAEAPAAGSTAAHAENHEHVPMARPVMLQGIITMVLLGLLVLMLIGVGVGVAWVLMDTGPKPPPPKPNPLTVTVKGPGISDIPFTAGPVLFCIDWGSSITPVYDTAVAMTQYSIQSLTGQYKLNLIFCREDQDKFAAADYLDGEKAGLQAVADFRKSDPAPGGATNVARALQAALDRKPRTIVLLARKPVEDAYEVAQAAKQQGVVIHTITIDGDYEVIRTMAKLAEITGGQSRSYTLGELTSPTIDLD